MDTLNKPIWKIITIADVVLVCLLVSVGIGSPFLLKKEADLSAEKVVIKVNGESWKEFTLGAAQELVVPGALGPLHLKTDGRTIWVSASACPNKYCIASGKAGRAGAWIACVPNKVLISIEGQPQEGELDGISE